MVDRKPIVINLFGGPGAGKSTGAAFIFSQLKMAGVNAELITEYAKDMVWQSPAVLKDQIYVYGKQNHRIERCADQVDVVVTDSPTLLSGYYFKGDEKTRRMLTDLIKHNDEVSYDNRNYLVNRVKPYNPAGRYQTESEADVVATQVGDFLDREGIEYKSVNGDIEGYMSIVDDVKAELGMAKPVERALADEPDGVTPSDTDDQFN